MLNKIIPYALLFFTLCMNVYSQESTIGYNYLNDEFVSYERIEDSDQYHEINKFDDYLVFGLLHQNEQGQKYVGGFNVYTLSDESFSDREHFEYLAPIFSTERDLVDPFAPWFFGIYHDLLFIDYGTGPGLRGLDIFDLKSHSIVYSGAHYSSFEPVFPNERTILTYRRIKTEEVIDKYPEVMEEYRGEHDKYKEIGLWYSFLRVFEIDLVDFTETDTGKIVGIVEQ